MTNYPSTSYCTSHTDHQLLDEFVEEASHVEARSTRTFTGRRDLHKSRLVQILGQVQILCPLFEILGRFRHIIRRMIILWLFT